jgi:hypothetical protein
VVSAWATNVLILFISSLISLLLILHFIWNRSRTGGGGPDETGEVEARRLECKRFLFEVREVIGESQYLTLVSILKSLNAKVLTIPKMKEGFTSILKNHPNLLSQFESYLPPAFRN